MNLVQKWTITFILLNFLIPKNLSAQDSEIPKINLGGALRFNYNYSDWKKESRKKGGEFGYDVFRINATGSYKNLTFNAEYRFYANSSGGGMLKHGWISYHFNPQHEIQVGQNIVPFGLQPYNSSNWFFSINYYLGLEDDADMGVKYVYSDENWGIDAAFYKNSDIFDFHSSEGISPSRYSYDVAGRNKEVNQGNIRIVRKFGEKLIHEAGLSALIGGIYNLDTENIGGRTAFGIHYKMDFKNFNLKAQYSNYKISPKNAEMILNEDGLLIPNPQEDGHFVEMAAYGAPYDVAAKAETYTLGIAYTIPVNKGILDYINIYNDFGWMHKKIDGMKDSYQNVAGSMWAMGPIFMYIDFAMGKNHPWLGPVWSQSFTYGGTDSWSTRFNINIGYYF